MSPLCRAIVLRHIDYGEADRVVTVLTAEQGIVKGFARNARKSRRRFGPTLEPFALIDLQLAPHSRGDLQRFESADLIDLRVHLRQSLDAFAVASYLCELTDLFLEGGTLHPDIFALLNATLDQLDRQRDPASLRLLFELRLIHALGWAPHLLHCAGCDGPLAVPLVFAVLAGGPLCPACAAHSGGLPVSPGTLGSLARCLQVPLDRLGEVQLGAVTRAEALPLLQAVLSAHWPRPPRSLTFLEGLAPRPNS